MAPSPISSVSNTSVTRMLARCGMSPSSPTVMYVDRLWITVIRSENLFSSITCSAQSEIGEKACKKMLLYSLKIKKYCILPLSPFWLNNYVRSHVSIWRPIFFEQNGNYLWLLHLNNFVIATNLISFLIKLFTSLVNKIWQIFFLPYFACLHGLKSLYKKLISKVK